MNKEKISDFIEVWAQAIGLTDTNIINFIKSDIAKRCTMYEKEIPSISIKDDKCAAYIIKPVNGQYSLEDFLLNRLMLGLREANFGEALEGNSGEYTPYNKTLNVNIGMLNTRISEKATRHPGLNGKNTQIIKKTIEHEIGHCLKTTFADGYKAPRGIGREQDAIYENLIKYLSSLKNGKYASQIKTIGELSHEGQSDHIKTGVRDAKNNYNRDYRIEWIDELLNETEALELTNSNDVHERWPLQDANGRNSVSGNYANVYNYISGYSTFTGYGSILKSLLGKKDAFHAEYISSTEIFKKFDEEYAEIVQEVWGLDPKKVSATQCIFVYFNRLVSGKIYDEETMLKLDEFFAKCYQKKIEKTISQSNGNISQEFRDATLQEIEHFQSRLTTNDDPQKREALAHNIVFSNIRARINQRTVQTQTKTESPKMKFINGFIQAYDDAEEPYQYETRARNDLIDLERIQEIIDTKGLNRMLTLDLEGKWIGRPGEDGFKVQYSQKQVSAMARLLKVAQLLTQSKKLNPEGRNYLEEFTNVPDIEYKLKQMIVDLNDKDSYMFELKQKAKENRERGQIPQYPPTQAEIEAADVPPTTLAQGQKQEMGTSQAQEEKELKGAEVVVAIKEEKIIESETQKKMYTIDEINEIKRLKFRQQTGQKLTEDEERRIQEYDNLHAQTRDNNKSQQNNQGMGVGL